MLKQRIITALILLPIALGGFFLLNGGDFALFIGFVVTLGAWEWARLAGLMAQPLRIAYADESGQETRRDIWPVQLAYYEGKQTVVAWCCLREAFRTFRTDRITAASRTESGYGRRRAVLSAEWREEWQREHPDWGLFPRG